jgi:hypothetical protein
MESVKNSLYAATGAFAATQLLSTGLRQQYSSVDWNHWGWSGLFSAFGGALAAYSVQRFIKDTPSSN